MLPYYLGSLKWKRTASLLVAFMLAWPPHLQSGARKPKGPDSLQTKKITWIFNGKEKSLRVVKIDNEDYFSIGSFAKLSQSQLRWQSVTQQACLSRSDGLLCFNWDRSRIYRDGNQVKKKYKLIYENRKLFIPAEFAKSKTFRNFTHTNITYSSRKELLTQNAPITLHLKPVENAGDYYRVGIDFEKATTYQFIDLSPKRVWIRFIRGRFSKSQILEGDKVIKEVRILQKRQSADLVMKLGSEAGVYDIHFDKQQNRLNIDVPTSSDRTIGNVAKKPNVEAEVAVAGLPRHGPVNDKRIRTIVIDAGHGGIDTGALGVRGTREKDINLKVAKALAQRLKKKKNLRVILTRDKDEFLALSQRTEIANRAEADLFVSIHCNSSISSKARGFEVYILSPEASDEAAAAVARIENSVIQLEAKQNPKASKVSELLASMAVYNFINESSECSARICRHVKKHSPVKKTGVKEANFHVLRGAQMPGVLVEMEYLSNPITELKLRSSRWRSQVVKGIAEGILEYDRKAREKDPAVVSTN